MKKGIEAQDGIGIVPVAEAHGAYKSLSCQSAWTKSSKGLEAARVWKHHLMVQDSIILPIFLIVKGNGGGICAWSSPVRVTIRGEIRYMRVRVARGGNWIHDFSGMFMLEL